MGIELADYKGVVTHIYAMPLPVISNEIKGQEAFATQANGWRDPVQQWVKRSNGSFDDYVVSCWEKSQKVKQYYIKLILAWSKGQTPK